MGKGKIVMPKHANKLDPGSVVGCNCPTECLLKEPIGERPPDGAVPMTCSNGDRCSYNKWIHKQCYEELEMYLIRVIQASAARTRDWTDEQCRKAMWGRVYDLIYRQCKCQCGGTLHLDEDTHARTVNDAGDEGKKKKPKAKKDLPKLVVDRQNVVGSSTYQNNTNNKKMKKISKIVAGGPNGMVGGPFDPGFGNGSDNYEPPSYIPGLNLSAIAPSNVTPAPAGGQKVSTGGNNGAAVCYNAPTNAPVADNPNKTTAATAVGKASPGDNKRQQKTVGGPEESAATNQNDKQQKYQPIAHHCKISIDDNIFLYADAEMAIAQLVLKMA